MTPKQVPNDVVEDDDEGAEDQEYRELTNEAIQAGIYDAYAEEGLLTAAGDADPDARDDRLLDGALEHECGSLDEREGGAIKQDDFVAVGFKKLTGKDKFAEADWPEQAEVVYGRISRSVMNAAKMDVQGRLQRRILPLGLVLCHTSVTKHGIPALYVTDSLDCLLADYEGPMGEGIVKAAKKDGRNLAGVVEHLPQHAEPLDKAFRKSMRRALTAGNAVLAPALTAATDDDENAE